MKHTGHATVNLPLDQVDLETWLFTLTDADYQATARGHRAAGTFIEDGVRGMVNVESIGGHLIVQHYREVSAAPSHVEMVSERSRVYLFHLVPVSVQVRWTMSVTARSTDTSDFHCTVELVLPPLLRLLGGMSALSFAIRAHTREETMAFADDITRKAQATQRPPSGT